jgi:hypothetical protein
MYAHYLVLLRLLNEGRDGLDTKHVKGIWIRNFSRKI